MEFVTSDLKREISQILGNYDVPLEDRSLLLEKIEEEVSRVVELVGKTISEDREKTRQGIESFRKETMDAVSEVVARGRSAAQKAYELGYRKGLEASRSTGPSAFQVVLTVGLLGLAAFVVVREFLPRKR